jgi:mannose-1-phosphate guanylyltransferase/mannose-6-phosphate isomerase
MAGFDVNRPTSETEGCMTTLYTAGQRDQRPWGSWEVIATGPRYAVKRIVVQPGKRLSLQSHAYRAEHWVVVGGAALVTRGSETFSVGCGGSVAIGRGEVHRIANPGQDELVFIEVQHGERLDENDITRFEDDHGRS